MKTKFYYLACLLLIQFAVKAQMKIGDNSTTINSASLLELETTNKGFVLPRVSISDVSAASPLPAGLLTGTVVYNTNAATTGGSGTGIYIWDGTKWLILSTGTSVNSSAWLLTGNSGLNSSTNFIGTTDAIDFVAKTANIERMRILGASGISGAQAGWIGMGITTPRSSLDVTGNYTNKNIITIQNTSSTGYSSVDMLDNTGALKGTFGYGNSGASASFANRLYFNTYGGDFLLTANSGTNHFFLKGGTGYVGINTSTPSERLHVVGNIYLNGAFMPGGDPGTSGYVLTSAGANTSPLWKNISSLDWSLTGNSGTSYATNFLGTTDFVSMRFRTNNIQRMIIDSLGRVGIGLTNPSYALSVLSQTNPLYLSGVQSTATFSTDSILTINAGIVKKTPYSSLTGNFWSLTGNAGTSYATNYLGTSDNVSLRFRTNNTERMIIDSLGLVTIGSSGALAFNTSNPPLFSVDYGTTTSNTIAYLRGSVDDYFQINLRNKSNSPYASTDYVATSDDGTDSTNYVDMGINSSTYAPGVENWGGPHDAYMYSSSRNLLLGCQSTSSDVIFLLAGGKIKTNTVFRLKGENGNVIVGTGEGSNAPVGNTLRGPNAQTSAVNTAGGSLTITGGSSTGTATGGSLNIIGGSTSGAGIGGSVNITGGSTSGGTIGAVNINTSLASATNINTGTSTGLVTIGGATSDVNLPKLSASAVVLTDASKNLTSTTPSNNTYLYYNGTNFTWQSAATLASFSVTAPLTYNNLTGVFGITKANTTTDGYLSATDWNTFNNKIGSITLNTPSSVFSNPINFSVASGAATGTLSLNTQAAGTVFAGPVNVASGTLPAVPTFRALVAADIPSLAGLYIQNQSTVQALSNFNISGNGTIGTNLNVSGKSTLTGVANTGTLTSSGGDVNININSNNSTNINTGTSTSNVTIGNSANNILFPKFNTAGGMIYTTAATGQIASTGSNMKWDDVNNRLGIGLTNPSYKLSVLSSSNPLYLSGVQATATFSSDSILTINAGVVKKAPYSSLPSASGWSLTGNSGTIPGTDFIGTTDFNGLIFKVNNAEAGYLGISGSSYAVAFGVGSSGSATATQATAIGASSQATLQYNTALGYNAQAVTSSQATAIGTNSLATGYQSQAFGIDAQATSGAQSLALGTSSRADNQYNIAMGYNAHAITGSQTMAIGQSSQATAYQSIALGSSAQAITNSQTLAIGVSATASGYQSTAIGNGTSASGSNSTVIGNGATTSQNNALILGNSSANIGIATTTPNTNAGLDVNAKFKLGDIGTVNKNVVSFSSTLGSTSLSAGTFGVSSFTASSVDVTITIPAAANYLTSTQATVSVSPNFDLPTSVSIASARMISTSQLKIRFVNSSTTTQTISGNLYITINEF